MRSLLSIRRERHPGPCARDFCIGFAIVGSTRFLPGYAIPEGHLLQVETLKRDSIPNTGPGIFTYSAFLLPIPFCRNAPAGNMPPEIETSFQLKRDSRVPQKHHPRTASLEERLTEALATLQDDMATIDMLRKIGGEDRIGLLLKELRLLRIRMDGNQNHERPHLHIDYHRRRHLASYAIDDGTLLAGDDQYGRKIRPWIETNRELLIEAWRGLRSTDGVDDTIIVQLRESKL